MSAPVRFAAGLAGASTLQGALTHDAVLTAAGTAALVLLAVAAALARRVAR